MKTQWINEPASEKRVSEELGAISAKLRSLDDETPGMMRVRQVYCAHSSCM